MGNVLLKCKRSTIRILFPVSYFLSRACHEGDVEVVRKILNEYPLSVNDRHKTTWDIYNNLDGMTPLMIAIKEGHIPLVEFLLQQPGIDVSAVYSGRTALMYAFNADDFNFKHANYTIADKLVKAGADINQCAGKANLLLWAWVRHNQEVALKLITMFDANIEMSEALFNTTQSSWVGIFGINIPQEIELTKQILHAKQLGKDLKRFSLPPEIILKISEFLFNKTSFELRAFEEGFEMSQEFMLRTNKQLTPKELILRPLAWLSDFANETRWQEWIQEYSTNPERPKQPGYGPGAIVPFKAR